MAAVLSSQCEDQAGKSEIQSEIHKKSESGTSKKRESDAEKKSESESKTNQPLPYIVTLMAAASPSQCEGQACASETEIYKRSEIDFSNKWKWQELEKWK